MSRARNPLVDSKLKLYNEIVQLNEMARRPWMVANGARHNKIQELANALFITAYEEKESTIDLMNITEQAIQFVRGHMAVYVYDELVNQLQQSASLTMQDLGRLMLQLPNRALVPFIIPTESAKPSPPPNEYLKKYRVDFFSKFSVEAILGGESILESMYFSATDALKDVINWEVSLLVANDARKVLDNMKKVFLSNKELIEDLFEIAIASINLLNGYMKPEEYNQLADEMKKHSSLSMRVLGGLMLALGVGMLAGAVFAVAGTGLAVVPVVGIGTMGLVLASVGVSFFAKKSVHTQLSESMKKLSADLFYEEMDGADDFFRLDI